MPENEEKFKSLARSLGNIVRMDSAFKVKLKKTVTDRENNTTPDSLRGCLWGTVTRFPLLTSIRVKPLCFVAA